MVFSKAIWRQGKSSSKSRVSTNSHLIRSCIFWRRYFKSFACQKDIFLQKIMQEHPISKAGPAFAFRSTLKSHGWTIEHDGFISYNNSLHFNWLWCSISMLHKMFTISWNCRVSQLCAKRNYFDIACFDKKKSFVKVCRIDLKQTAIIWGTTHVAVMSPITPWRFFLRDAKVTNAQRVRQLTANHTEFLIVKPQLK